jgi:hypothetical protein
MERQTIESAIIALDDLLRSATASEDSCQRWLESHPVVFQILGFKASIAKPQILCERGDVYIPDFLVQRANGTWEIFEIKIPATSILLDVSRRHAFYASFERYLAQCHEYSDALGEIGSRERLEMNHRIHVQPGPTPSTLLAGRSIGLDFDRMAQLASRRTPPISICTFDDVLNSLLAFRTTHFADSETTSGFSIYCMTKFHHPRSPYTSNWLMDLGIKADRDRAALLIDGAGRLKLKVWDSNCKLHEAVSHDPLTPSDYEVPLWLGCEVAVSGRYGYMSIQVDWRYRVDIRLVGFPFAVSDAYVLGTDWTGTKNSWFSMNEVQVYHRPLGFTEKLHLRHHDLARHHAIQHGPANRWVEFKGHKWLATKVHPIHHRPHADSGGDAPEPAF